MVHERLKEFECEYPIAVFAGSKDKKAIESSFDKLKYLSITETMPQKEIRDIETKIPETMPQKEIRDIETKIPELYAEQQKLQQFLNEKIPQRITQAKHTAWKSYLRHLEIKREIEIELSVLTRQCLNRRIDDVEPVRREVLAWQEFRNNKDSKVNWQFTTEDARIKLHRLYPTLED